MLGADFVKRVIEESGGACHADVLAAGGQRRGVVNLDGVVDHRSFAALRARRLDAWLDEQGVRYLVDGPQQFAMDPSIPHACGRYFDGAFGAPPPILTWRSLSMIPLIRRA